MALCVRLGAEDKAVIAVRVERDLVVIATAEVHRAVGQVIDHHRDRESAWSTQSDQ
jgi:hypothetical protein